MNPSETAALGERLEAVRGRLAGAARIAGRKPEDVRLIAVSKLHPVEAILAASATSRPTRPRTSPGVSPSSTLWTT